ncbi:MAG: DNA-directed RNA polymerase subunit beta' [Candidatus Jorgensenbacteria bacterium GW2011_GWA2_45_13]|uniref:DNA-directed RNA polymerase subunit beta' n=1 Tax=Candidatus Jorgensenbacteria bacterium GW2011_GWA2_45_13 TaxID=1618662 RepID=A0A0G1L8Q3_9BACT|nr:MAG: DNA-directed RNA polymerase subunit beta' [Candidatus Jorgensenbacteria bacterium GW2011_GWA2_45_13]
MRKKEKKSVTKVNRKNKNNMNKNVNVQSISIRIASPEEILSWSHGEVLKPETLNYRTQRPEKDGLFSERIFGPTKDYECYCGKYKKIRYKGITCEKCGVEVTRAVVRRERMAHIALATPVTHIWFLRNVPSKLSLLLNISVPKLEKVIYYAAFIVTSVNEENRKRTLGLLDQEFKSLKQDKSAEDKEGLKEAKEQLREIVSLLQPGLILTESEYYTLADRFGDVFEADRGAGAVRKILEQLDLKAEIKTINKELETVRDANRTKRLLRRLFLVKSLHKARIRPEWMVLTNLPILPPELRPMVALEGGRYATADLNDLYRRVINRNNRLKKLMELKSPEVIITNEKRMLQEAVDALIDNSARSGTQLLSSRRRPLRSLADMLKGKQGRFRQNLLGKRVDYSARSVIVVGPELKLDECGLPKNLALELFRHFVINKIIERGLAYNIKQANRFIEQRGPEVWAILEEVIADNFDGDQMAVHLPLTIEAQYEASNLMNAGHNLLKPANGEPITRPSQDIVLGSYFLTRIREGGKGEGKIFSNFTEVMLAYENGLLSLNAEIVYPMYGELLKTSYGRIIFNSILPKGFRFVNQMLTKKLLTALVGEIIDNYGIEHSQEYLDAIKDLGFSYATFSSVTWGISDTIIPPEKKEIIAEGDGKVEIIESQYGDGLLTEQERKEKIIEVWSEVKEKVAERIPHILPEDNPIYSIIDSGARGSWAQPIQMMGMKGLVLDASGETIELPIKSSYKEGMGVLEYFTSTHAARKGSTDTALKTASAGYLTRRLVDVAQDLIIYDEDCKTTEGVEIRRADGDAYGYKFRERLFSRTTLDDIRVDRKLVVRKGEIIGKEVAEIIHDSKLEAVMVRSPITCKAHKGLCATCFGLDLSKNKKVVLGEAVGIIAAQSIGEPGTQLTMRTFHIGGVAGFDITYGLPRIEEIFEARPPKGKAVIAKEDGTVIEIKERGLSKVIEVMPKNKKKTSTKSKKKTKAGSDATEYIVPLNVNLFVKEGDSVLKGKQLSEGPLDLRELLMYRGLDETRRYIIDGVQQIYVPEGASINDKYIEIIVRQMFSRAVIKESGDTELMVDQVVDRQRFMNVNREMRRLKKQPAKAVMRILGITRVSLTSESFLSAASFQETSRVLVNAASGGKIDDLVGLKENVIIGKLIPAGTGFRGIPQEFIKAAEEKMIRASEENAHAAAETASVPEAEKENI